jgi:hypothetical protein
MPIRSFVEENSFDPEVLNNMGKAFGEACTSLGLADKSDAVTKLVAMMIVELAKGGEHDPDQLKAAVLKRFRQ